MRRKHQHDKSRATTAKTRGINFPSSQREKHRGMPGKLRSPSRRQNSAHVAPFHRPSTNVKTRLSAIGDDWPAAAPGNNTNNPPYSSIYTVDVIPRQRKTRISPFAYPHSRHAKNRWRSFTERLQCDMRVVLTHFEASALLIVSLSMVGVE